MLQGRAPFFRTGITENALRRLKSLAYCPTSFDFSDLTIHTGNDGRRVDPSLEALKLDVDRLSKSIELCIFPALESVVFFGYAWVLPHEDWERAVNEAGLQELCDHRGIGIEYYPYS
jgi:hypothetical protein